MIYEWRTYRFAPGQALAYLRDFQSEGLPLVTRHLPMLGYWLTETGRLNVLHHLWAYESLSHRAQCRATLAADTDWTQGFGPRAFPMIEQQENLLLTLGAGSEALSQALAATSDPLPAAHAEAPMLGAGWAVLEIAKAAPPDTEATARWQVVSGAAPGTHLTLWSQASAAEIALTPRPAIRREVMRPTGFSPLG